jgi:hypothetical protein
MVYPPVPHTEAEGAPMHAAPRPRMMITAPLLRSDGELHIVGHQDVLTLYDPDGAIQRLVELADGSRSTNELFLTLAPDHPQLSHQDVHDAVAELEAAGLLEICAPRRRILGAADRRHAALLYR